MLGKGWIGPNNKTFFFIIIISPVYTSKTLTCYDCWFNSNFKTIEHYIKIKIIRIAGNEKLQ